MKKMLALILVCMMLLGIVGCGGEETAQADPTETAADMNGYSYNGLSMGYAMADITPKESTPLTGFGVATKRWSNEIGYPLKATAMALTDAQGETILLYEIDLISDRSKCEEMRLRISNATGVPENRIMLGFSHTHAGPGLECTNEPAIINYTKDLFDALSNIGVEALADRKPVEVSFGQTETEGLNHVRHYINTLPDGSKVYFGDNFNHDVKADSTTVHTTQADPTLYVVKFSREGERDLLLCNFRAHPSLHGKSRLNIVSSDYIGAYREAVNIELDCDFMYMQGACGNINQTSYISGETLTEDCGEYGAALLKYTKQALENMTPVEGNTVGHTQQIVEEKVNKDLDHLFFEAKNIQAAWNINRDIDEALAMCRPYGISSPFHAGAIVTRHNMPDTATFELNTLRIGDNLAMVICPFEMFDTLTVYVEENADYDTVLTMGYANNVICYMPTTEAFEHTCYESDTCRFTAGTGERIRDMLLDMLEQIKAAP